MKPLYLNDFFRLTENEIANSKIELNMTNGKGGDPCIDRWLPLTEEKKQSGLVECSYWGWYQGKRNFYPGQNVFSFCRLNERDWLFLSAGKIMDVPQNSHASVEILRSYQPLFGRLIICFEKGNTYSRYVFKLASVIERCLIKEILPGIYTGEKFPGYDNLTISFRQLKKVLAGEMMPSYAEALKEITGVYCLTDKKTGKLYIGSATGEGGLAQRWGTYLQNAHGDNQKLIALHREKGTAYFDNNFTFTLLEYYTLSYDSAKILQREQIWKDRLQTKKFGYNGN